MASNIIFMANNVELTPLGKWIKGALVEKGRNQSWLAKQINVEPPQVSRIMRGESEALPYILNKIADALKKKRSEIYRAAGHIEPIPAQDKLDEDVLFHLHRLPLEERERWVRVIEGDSNNYEQRKASKSTSKTRA